MPGMGPVGTIIGKRIAIAIIRLAPVVQSARLLLQLLAKARVLLSQALVLAGEATGLQLPGHLQHAPVAAIPAP
jgi:hypothetical protein